MHENSVARGSLPSVDDNNTRAKYPIIPSKFTQHPLSERKQTIKA